MNLERYTRQTMLSEIGEEGQRKLADARVLIVGLGGLGAPVATYLTGAGFGHLGLCDPDVVSLNNLQRQTLYCEAMIGRPKTECAFERLQALNSETTFTLHPEGLTPENAVATVARYDLVMDCTDNFAARFLIDDACAETRKTWVHGAIGEFRGEVSVFGFPEAPRRFADLYPDREAMLALPKVVKGVMGPVPGVIGSVQACEAIKIVAGCGTPLAGRLFAVDLLSMQPDIIYF